MSTVSNEELEEVINQIYNDDSFRGRLSGSILSSLYSKIRFYQSAYMERARSIITQDQPRVFKKLCTLGQTKPVVEYEESGKFYTMIIPRRVRYDPMTRSNKAYTEEEYQSFVKTRDSDRFMFEIDSQCATNPAAGVVYNYIDKLSESPEVSSSDYLGLDDKLPGGRTYAYSLYSLQQYLKDHSEIVDWGAKSGIKVSNMSKKVIIDLIYGYFEKVLGKDKHEANKDVQEWSDRQRSEPSESKKEYEGGKGKGSKDRTGVDALLPQYDDVKGDLNFYTTSLSERQEVMVMIDTLKDQFDALCSYSLPFEELGVKGTEPPVLDLAKVRIDAGKVARRLYELLKVLQDFKSSIIGTSRRKIRDEVANIIKIFSNNWRAFSTSYINGVLLGPPGSGKTETAKSVGKIFAKLGILGKGEFQFHSRASMVGQYIGETALKVRNILASGLENVLFIDEAYALAQGSDGSFDPYGVEAVNEIVGFLDKYRGKICIIAAGYECEMDKYWFGVNPGLRRRTRFNWTMEEFSAEELFMIIKKNVETWKSAGATFPSSGSATQQKNILENQSSGVHLLELLKAYLPLLVNQGGDAELIADMIISRYYEKNVPLSSIDLDDIMYRFLWDRKTRYYPKDQLTNCKSIPDEEATTQASRAVESLKSNRISVISPSRRITKAAMETMKK